MEQDYNTDLPEEFPGLMDFFEHKNAQVIADLNELYHLLEAQSEITKTTLYGSFEDDHVTCYNVGIEVNGKEYKMSLMYITDGSFLFNVARAPFMTEDHAIVVKYLMASMKDSVDVPQYIE